METPPKHQASSNKFEISSQDSGYVSQNHESNADSLMLDNGENPGKQVKSDIETMYLGEDALLEKPDISAINVEHNNLETDTIGSSYFSQSDSILEASIESLKTNYSGFDESEISMSQQSDNISVITPIKVNYVDNKYFQNPTLRCTSSDKNYLVNAWDSQQHTVGHSGRRSVQNTPQRGTRSNRNAFCSPDLFCEENSNSEQIKASPAREDKLIFDVDRYLLKQVHESLKGVPPPPSFTSVKITAEEMLQKIEDNKNLFVWENEIKMGNMSESCAFSSYSEVTEPYVWPDIMDRKLYGLHYNKGKVSEDLEYFCCKHATRYIGTETHSSLIMTELSDNSPAKKRISRLRRAIKSPGKRLSHLARRRITFSKESLTSTTSNSFMANRTRQILVDARKLEMLKKKSPYKKSPRKTPRKSPRKRVRTPGSSAKKRSLLKRVCTRSVRDGAVGPSTAVKANATKRALFQSPEIKTQSTMPLEIHSDASTSSGSSSRRKSPRRALFTSPFKSPSKSGGSWSKTGSKRALFTSPTKTSQHSSDSEQALKTSLPPEDTHSSKFPRSLSLPVSNTKPKSISRTHSSSSLNNVQAVSELRKKKLLWAVSEALRSQNVGMQHPQFKNYASTLARVIRRLVPNLFTNGPRLEGSTSENMLRIARVHVFAVTRGKTVEDIIKEHDRNKTILPNKLVGYVSADDFISNKENEFRGTGNAACNDCLRSSERPLKPMTKRDENIERIRRAIDFGAEEDRGDNNLKLIDGNTVLK